MFTSIGSGYRQNYVQISTLSVSSCVTLPNYDLRVSVFLFCKTTIIEGTFNVLVMIKERKHSRCIAIYHHHHHHQVHMKHFIMSTLTNVFFRLFTATQGHGSTMSVKIPWILSLSLHQAPLGFLVSIEKPPSSSSSLLGTIFEAVVSSCCLSQCHFNLPDRWMPGTLAS